MSDANSGDMIRNTYVCTTFRVHIIREGGHHQLVPSVGRPGAVLFLFIYCILFVYFIFYHAWFSGLLSRQTSGGGRWKDRLSEKSTQGPGNKE